MKKILAVAVLAGMMAGTSWAGNTAVAPTMYIIPAGAEGCAFYSEIEGIREAMLNGDGGESLRLFAKGKRRGSIITFSKMKATLVEEVDGVVQLRPVGAKSAWWFNKSAVILKKR